MIRHYKTIQGDMWDSIAKGIYGDERYMVLLLDANPDYVDYVVFPAGIRLVCPDASVPIHQVRPPWKR